jgi:hypothetical protein
MYMGGKGFGKSHIFLALTCLLVRQGLRIVYLPDCREMLRDPLDYLKTAFFFAFADSESFMQDIYHCESVEVLADFCAQYQMIGRLCFVVDQLNDLDPEPIGEDEIADERKFQVQRMSRGHIEITRTSANHKSAKHMATRDVGDRGISFMAGMMTVRAQFSAMTLMLIFPSARGVLLVATS